MITSLLKTFTVSILISRPQKKEPTFLQWSQGTVPSSSLQRSHTHFLDLPSNTLAMLPPWDLECSLCLRYSSLRYPQGALTSSPPSGHYSEITFSMRLEQLYLKSQASTYCPRTPLFLPPIYFSHSLKHVLTNSIICQSITFYAYCLSPPTRM